MVPREEPKTTLPEHLWSQCAEAEGQCIRPGSKLFDALRLLMNEPDACLGDCHLSHRPRMERAADRGSGWRQEWDVNLSSRMVMGLGAGLLLLAGPAVALSGSSFESTDGNLIVSGGAGAMDWANAPNFVGGNDLATGQNDDSLGQGTKEDTEPPVSVTGGIPNNKSDLLRFYTSHEVIAGDVVLYLGWVRANTLGTANMDFELNQSSTLSSNGVTPIRTEGDVLITFDFASGGNIVQLSLLQWLADPTLHTTAECEASSRLPCWGNKIDLDAAGFADGAVNEGFTVFDPIANVTLADATFGEAAINLTAAGVISSTSCIGFASAYLKSRSSDSFTAALKDFVAPAPVSITQCGSIDITKVDDVNAVLQGAVFTLYTDVDTTDTGFDPVNDVSTGKSCTTDASGECSLLAVDFGTYWVVETTTPSGHRTADPQQVTISSTSASVSLTFTNPRLFTVITVVCQESNGALYPSFVTLDGTVLRTLDATDTLPSGASATEICALGGARFENKTAGTYNASVEIPTTVETSCTDASDNDEDTLVDCADTDCALHPACI